MPSSRLKLPSLLAAVVLLAGCSGTAGSSSDTSMFYSTSEVAIGNVSEIVSSYGRVAAQEEETMTFDSVSGTVSEVYVSAGQTVQEGDSLVSLDTSDLEEELVEANAELVVAEAKLREEEVTASESAVLEAEATLATAENQVSQAYLEWQIAINSGIASLQDDVADAEYNLEKAQQDLELTELTSQSSNIRQLEYDIAFFERTLRDLDDEEEEAEIEEELAEAEDSLTSAQTSRESAIQNAQDAVDQAEEELETAQAKLNLANAGTYDPIASAELAYEQAVNSRDDAQEALDELNEGGDPASVEAAQTAYDAALADVQDIEEQIADTTLCAPFDGVVFSVNVESGDTVSATDSIIYIANMSALGASGTVSEVDYSLLEMGQSVLVTFDAYPDITVTGELSEISEEADSDSTVPTFDIEVVFSDTPEEITPGITANLNIIVGELKDVLTVAAAAIQQDGDTVYVQVQKNNGDWETREVSIGLSDGTLCEVLDGLEEGETVMIPVVSSGTSSEDEEEATVEATIEPIATTTPESAESSTEDTTTVPEMTMPTDGQFPNQGQQGPGQGDGTDSTLNQLQDLLDGDSTSTAPGGEMPSDGGGERPSGEMPGGGSGEVPSGEMPSGGSGEAPSGGGMPSQTNP